jgi:DNA-binding transcriptional LysR family regulator
MNLRSVDLNLLVTFEAVLTERSVSAAAERLGVTQSAVSHALQRLRAVFHDQLLVRGPAGMEPTPRALEIAEVVTGALGHIEQVISQQRSFDPATSQRSFTLRVSEYVAPFLLPTLCSWLRQQAPRVTLNVVRFSAQDEDGRIQPHEVHVRMASPDSLPAGCTRVRLLEDEFVVLMSRKHPEAGQPMTLAHYLGLPHVKVAATALGTNMIDDALARRGLRRNVVLTVPSWFEMRGVIANTDLVAAIPGQWANDPTFSEGCLWHTLPMDEVTFAVDMRSRTRDTRDPGQRWLCDLITRAITVDSHPSDLPPAASAGQTGDGFVSSRSPTSPTAPATTDTDTVTPGTGTGLGPAETVTPPAGDG